MRFKKVLLIVIFSLLIIVGYVTLMPNKGSFEELVLHKSPNIEYDSVSIVLVDRREPIENSLIHVHEADGIQELLNIFMGLKLEEINRKKIKSELNNKTYLVYFYGKSFDSQTESNIYIRYNEAEEYIEIDTNTNRNKVYRIINGEIDYDELNKIVFENRAKIK